MANKTPLTHQTTKVCFIVGLEKVSDGYDLSSACDNLRKNFLEPDCDMYGYALHDQDLNQDGTPKFKHLHFCIRLKKKKRLSTIINTVAKCLDVTNFAVRIEENSSFEGYFQYLIHRGWPDKHQYDPSIIVSNLDNDERDMILETKTKSIQFEDIVAKIREGMRLLDLIDYLGLSVYQHYRASISDIYKEIDVRSQEERRLCDENSSLRRDLSNLYVGLCDLMSCKSAMVYGYVSLAELQEFLESVSTIRLKYGKKEIKYDQR